MNNEKYLKHIFNYFDINKNGLICCEEFKSIITQCNIEQYRDKTVEQIIADVDTNKDGKIDYGEFLKSMERAGSWAAMKTIRLTELSIVDLWVNQSINWYFSWLWLGLFYLLDFWFFAFCKELKFKKLLAGIWSEKG